MNYEQKYKQALKRARDYYLTGNGEPVDFIKMIFPELKDSDDEKVRLEIRNFIWEYPNKLPERTKWLAWLEKQCNKIVDCPQNHQDVNHPNGGIVMVDFNGGEGFYKLHLDYLNKKQVEEIEEMVRTWNKESKQCKYLENYDESEKEKADFVGDGFIECHADFLDFKEGNTYWFEYIGDDNYNVRSDNLLGKTYHITPCQLYTVFKKLTWLEKQGEKKINHTDIKEIAHQIAWETSKNYDPSLSKEAWCEMAALDMASWLKREVDDAYLQGICDAKNEIEKQGELNNNDTDILNRFSFYLYKDEPNILYLSELYVNKEQRNKGIGTKILKIADNVAANMKCNSIRLKTEIGSNAERLYRKNGYNSLKMEGNQVWLEKQSAQKHTTEIKSAEESLGIDSETYNKIVDECIYGDDEQKPVDKVEPKFKVRDWIVTPQNKVLQITNIEYIDGTSYVFNNASHYWEIYYCDKQCHLWSIDDAKNGDLLVDEDNNIGIYSGEKDDLYGWNSCIYLSCNNKLYLRGYHEHKNTKPATKEQRDLLFKKMKEAGYEWNAEKKELKKIEPKPLDANKVIEWLERNSSMFWDSPCNPSRIVELFKKDFEI